MPPLDHQYPWTQLPAEVVPVLVPHLPDVAAEMIEVVRRNVPVYVAPLDGGFGDAIRQGVVVALNRFLQLPGTTRPALSADDRGVYESLGRAELRVGRSMESLLAAYRLGARTTLRSLSESAMAAGFDARVLIGLGESVLAYIEELSAASAEGFAAAQSERAGDRDRLRDTVADMLVRGHADEESMRAAAAAAGWALPERVVAATVPLDRWEGLRARLGERGVLSLRPGDAVVIAPEPATSASREALARRLAGRAAVIGPGRPWYAAPDSLRLAVLARDVLDGQAPGHTPDAPFWVDGRLGDLVLMAEPTVVQDLAARRLAPLAGMRPGQRERLTVTLLSWLRHHGQRGAMASELGVHEQTVGYRVNQLRDAFGATLGDPQARFELELVLRARELTDARPARHADAPPARRAG